MNRYTIPGPPTDEELRRSEERFRVLSSIATEGLMIHENRVVLDANQAFVDLVGLSSLDDLVGHNGMDQIQFTPESRQRILEHMRSGSEATYDIEIVRPDGTIIPAETHGRDIEYQGRQARLVYMRDIRERRKASEALRDSERNYREIFNATNDALVIHDETGRIVDVNERMCMMFGCKREDALGRSANDFSLGESPYSEAEVQEVLRQSAASGTNTIVWRSKRWNGELFWSEVALRSCVIGGRDRVIASVRDISDRKEAEDALASEKRFADAVFESLPGVAYVYDEEGYLVRWNRNYEVENKRNRQELERGEFHVLETICEQDRDRIAKIYDDILQRGSGEAEFGMLRSDGEVVPFFATGRVGVLAGKRYVVGLGFDISDRIASEAEKADLQAQLLHASKMEAVGQLAGGVAHDFNNLLTVVAGNIELAAAEVEPDSASLVYLDQVQKAANSATELTRQMLAFSRRQIIEPKLLNLNDLVTAVQKLLDRLIGEHISIQTRLAKDLGTVNIDRTQFEQVLVNLAVNARDAMPDGGELVIETADVDLKADDSPRPAGLQPGLYVRLTVTDTGHGMSEDVRSRVFEPFFTTKEKGRGTGLGLATIFGSIEQAGGAIDVQSTVGSGTAFRIFLPHQESQATDQNPEARTGKMPRGNETILLVEDDESVRELVDTFLQRLGYTVLQAPSGKDAVAMIAKDNTPFGLLLTDVVMPGLSGRETAESLTLLQPDLKVLFMSGYADDSIVRQRIIEDNLDFVAKPFDLRTLAEKLRDILDRDSER